MYLWDGTDGKQTLNIYRIALTSGYNAAKKNGRIKLNQINQTTKKYQSTNRMVLVFVCVYVIYIYILIRVVYTYIFLKELFHIIWHIIYDIYMFLIQILFSYALDRIVK